MKMFHVNFYALSVLFILFGPKETQLPGQLGFIGFFLKDFHGKIHGFSIDVEGFIGPLFPIMNGFC